MSVLRINVLTNYWKLHIASKLDIISTVKQFCMDCYTYKIGKFFNTYKKVFFFWKWWEDVATRYQNSKLLYSFLRFMQFFKHASASLLYNSWHKSIFLKESYVILNRVKPHIPRPFPNPFVLARQIFSFLLKNLFSFFVIWKKSLINVYLWHKKIIIICLQRTETFDF